MPLWKIHHPVDAYTPADKKEFAGAITAVYDAVPIPRFYVVVLFEEVPADSFYVGGDSHGSFVRIQIDQMARTLPGRSSGNGGSGISTRLSPPGSRTAATTGSSPSPSAVRPVVAAG